MHDTTYSFNTLLKNIRLEFGFTQKELADKLNCSQELISRIEKGKRDIADDILLSLSTLYKTNLFDYQANFKNFKNFSDYKLYHELLALADDENNIELIQAKLNDNRIANFDYGEPLLLKNYCQSLVELYIQSNYDKCIKICLSSLECSSENLISIELNTLKSPFYYSSILTLAPALFKSGKVELAKTVSELFLKHFELMLENEFFNYSKNSYLYAKYTVLIMVNYAEMILATGDYLRANELCDESIRKSGLLNTLSGVHHILKTKSEAIYLSGNHKDAAIIFRHLEIYCKYSGLDTYFNKTSNLFKTIYPEIFNLNYSHIL